MSEKTDDKVTGGEVEEVVDEANASKVKGKKRNISWMLVAVIVLSLIVVGGASGGYMLHLSNTSPEFCATCHIMEKNVTSYLTSDDLDNIHYQAGVECKECHDYPIPAEITSGIKYAVGNYYVGDDGELMPVDYGNDICLKCHISYEHVAKSTDYLKYNPHDNHNGQMPCDTCHQSHDDHIDYCSSCHDNGGQRILGAEWVEREKIE